MRTGRRLKQSEAIPKNGDCFAYGYIMLPVCFMNGDRFQICRHQEECYHFMITYDHLFSFSAIGPSGHGDRFEICPHEP